MIASVPLSGAGFLLATAVSLLASILLVSRLEAIAGRVGMSEAILGLIVALAADSPEITASVSASLHGQRAVGVGVVLGSNVFNIAALLGLAAIVARRIALHGRVVILDGGVGIYVAAVAILAVAVRVPPIVCLGLLALVVVPYVVVSAHKPNLLRRLGVPEGAVAWIGLAVAEEETEMVKAIHPISPARHDVAVAVASLAVVVLASTVMEQTASSLGAHFHLSSLVIGGLVLAGVTGLPNAVGAVFFARRGRGAAVLSTAMNSNLLNVMAGLLLPALFLGLPARSAAGLLVAATYAGLTLLAVGLAYAARGLGRRDGAVIVGVYVAFVITAVAIS